ncbi:acylneuraminate cytidylyltransferase [Streptomyces sp. I6]|uniref:acylneuraminate cytidylyltransferase n=1 Tax=Streptomyces sp. I6 TaxID=2483113 RepID=UPI000F452B7C|nr:acylneuraminate cytidylyltransferase [Streptomyces sp. I6]RNL72468.1 acylneuraminate cytidylyltransferase [Streptomyces sp. I6]
MTTVLAVIPARGGSKGVPGKNLAAVGGVPLVARAVRACVGSALVTDVVVSTDDPAVADAARAAGAALGATGRVHCVDRPADIAGDAATSESAVLHAMDAYEAVHGRTVDVALLVQCTSPFLTSDDIDGVASAVAKDGADTAVTVAPFHAFVWRRGPAADTPASAGALAPVGGGSAAGTSASTGVPASAGGGSAGATLAPTGTAAPTAALAPTAAPTGTAGDGGRGVNHDKSHRPRRQDRPEDFLETGAAYAMDARGFRVHGHRFFGHTALVETDPARVLEIDDPHDLARARALAPLLDAAAVPTRADVDAVVLDFDGTQTDDRVLIDSEGRELVAVHRGDGLGIAALRRAGLKLLILSTEQNPVVAARARKLNLPVLHGIDRKDAALRRWCEESGVAPERVLYAGNDVNDLSCFGLVGWPVAVASAHDSVRAAARAVTTTPGGAGAVREIATWLLGPTLATPTQ